VKLSISLSETDVAALDEYLRSSGLPSRSAAVQRAIRLLRHEYLEQDYAAAWQSWDGSDEAVAWDTTTHDGLD
jgi:Arc/MetJ-type ribon-helix-helix transcriptional regulator